jgi:hypothetical protein
LFPAAEQLHPQPLPAAGQGNATWADSVDREFDQRATGLERLAPGQRGFPGVEIRALPDSHVRANLAQKRLPPFAEGKVRQVPSGRGRRDIAIRFLKRDSVDKHKPGE